MSSSPERLRIPIDADAEAIAALYAGRRSIDADEVRTWFRNPTFDLLSDFRVVERHGAIVGYADAQFEGERLWVDWTAQDASAGHGLLDWAMDRAREMGAARLRCWAWEPDGELVDVVRGRGFEPARTSLELEVELRDPIPEPVWPQDVAVRAVLEGEEPGIHALIEEAFADTNDFRPTPYDEWAAWALVPNRLDRDLWFAALQDGEIVAVAVCEHQRGGEPGLGWVETLAVRRAWRRRGLGTALLLHAFGELRARGRTAVGLSVDAENPTGAVRVYESVGMRPVRTRVLYEKRLPAAGPV
jgi:mycothiol synthase